MAKEDIILGLLSGVISGWIVLVFGEGYYKFKHRLSNHFAKNKFILFIIDLLLPVLGLLILIIFFMIAINYFLF